MDILIFVFLFFIGLFIGSFLNVLIDRIPKGESIVKGRSYCDSCKKKLVWYDLIPVLSFIFLKRKCRRCKSSISLQYPVVELITGILFLLVFSAQFSTFNYFTSGESWLPLALQPATPEVSFTPFATFIFQLYIVSSLIVIFFADLKYGIIPNKVLYPAVLITLFAQGITLAFVKVTPFAIFNFQFSIFNYLLSAGGAFLFFLSIFLLTKGRGMGFGDVKLSFLIGLILGFPKIVVAFYIAFLTGAAISLILVLWRKKRLHGGTIPFGPFLVLGTLVALFAGNLILQRVFSFLLY